VSTRPTHQKCSLVRGPIRATHPHFHHHPPGPSCGSAIRGREVPTQTQISLPRRVLSLLSFKQSATRSHIPLRSLRPQTLAPPPPRQRRPTESDGCGRAGRGSAPRAPRPHGGERRDGRRLRPQVQGRRGRPALRQQGRALPQPQVRPSLRGPLRTDGSCSWAMRRGIGSRRPISVWMVWVGGLVNVE
jgi:hypothetical protein